MKKAMARTLLVATVLGVYCLAGAGCTRGKVQRFGSVIGVKEEKLEEYKRLHADVWPGVLKMIKECNIRNYSIYVGQLDDGNYYLFSYFEYTGDDFAVDMKKMAADPTTQKWWSVCEPCQIPQKNRKETEWWMTMEEVFYLK
jgi:L-rhamnose mutarotase